MSAAPRRGVGPEQHIGNPKGRIAIWCDEREAYDIAAHYSYPDTFSMEIHEAVEKAYPVIEEDE